MARLRQLYEDVMDVALRATLKEFGFKRKSYATYIMERPDRRWYFELEAEPRLGTGFEDMAGCIFRPSTRSARSTFPASGYSTRSTGPSPVPMSRRTSRS